MMRTVVAIAVGVLVFVAMAERVDAREKGQRRQGGNPEAAFKKMDADGNGTVTCEEFIKARNPANDEEKQKLEERFKKMDADSNGQLTLEELKKAMEANPPKGKPEGKKQN